MATDILLQTMQARKNVRNNLRVETTCMLARTQPDIVGQLAEVGKVSVDFIFYTTNVGDVWDEHEHFQVPN